MSRMLIDPRTEAPALRRAAGLLERVIEDGDGRTEELTAVEAGLRDMLQAAAAGRLVERAEVEQMRRTLAHVSEATDIRIHGTLSDVLWRNAFTETRLLLQRLARPARLSVRADGQAHA